MINTSNLELRRRNRLLTYLGMPLEKPKKRDFFEDTNYIYLGTKREWERTNPNDKSAWEKIEIPSEFAWVVWSRQGTLKSIFIKTILPYFYNKGYKIFIFEAKDGTLSRSLRKNIKTDRIYPDAYTMELPIVSLLPTYLTSPNLPPAAKVPDSELKHFDGYCTLNATNIVSTEQWDALFGRPGAGAETLHILNTIFKGDLELISKQLDKGYYINVNGQTNPINAHTRPVCKRIIDLIRIDDYMNSKRGVEINLEELWNKNKVVIMPFYQKRPPYMQLYVAKMYDKFDEYHGKHPEAKMLIIHDDAQAYLNRESDINNPANEAVRNSIKFGRTKCINNIFTIQEMYDFHPSIYAVKTALFAGLITEFFNVSLNTDIKYRIIENRQNYKEAPLPNSSLKKKTIRYLYVPDNELEFINYFPQDPLCGGW
jgi:hypothetical protein